MKLFKLLFLPLVGLLTISHSGSGINAHSNLLAAPCAIENTAFQSGEKVSFNVYYTVGGVYVNAGAGSFSINAEKLNGKSVYHITGVGKTLASYEWAYKAYDTYETWVDVETMQPLKFVRNISEGGYKKYQTANFNKSSNTVITNEGVFKVPVCVQDVVSAVFYARNIDYNKLRTNDRVAFNLYLDNEVYSMHIRYEGKEVISTKYGKFKAIRLKPLTIKGTIFEGGEKMTVWVTDDANRVPIRVESPIIVGKVRIDMMDFKGLRSPMAALVKRL